MAMHAYWAALLMAVSLAGGSEGLRPIDETPLLAGDPALVDVNQLAVVLMTAETPGVEKLIDAVKLKVQVSQKLRDGGIALVEPDAQATRKLVVYIEGIDVPETDQYVYRVQTALCGLVTMAGQENRQIQTEVWRVRPVMAVAVKAQAGEAISAAVLVQAGAFVGAREAARRLSEGVKDAGLSRTQSTPQGLMATASYPLVASKNGDVFHRSDCRWAQNISGSNRIGYQTSEEAARSGKRPCKSCRP